MNRDMLVRLLMEHPNIVVRVRVGHKLRKIKGVVLNSVKLSPGGLSNVIEIRLEDK